MAPVVPLAAAALLFLFFGGGEDSHAASAAPGGVMVTDPAEILDAKKKLGIWGREEHAIDPAGYPEASDLNASIDVRFMTAVRSFQRWVNETASKAGELRDDGVMDPQTKDAIDAYALDVGVSAGKAG